MSTINIETLEGLPQECMDAMKEYHESLLKNQKFEFINELSYEAQVVSHFIGDKAIKHNIICHHYTRANPDDILQGGLKSRTGDEIRRTFLDGYGNLFSDEEKDQMKEAWSAMPKAFRDNYIFFCLVKCPLDDFGRVAPLLTNFGGEQIYMPFKNHPTITAKLKSIGKPLIVQCRVNPQNLQNIDADDLGMAIVSSYCRRYNSRIELYDADVYQNEPVPAENIVSIEEVDSSIIEEFC